MKKEEKIKKFLRKYAWIFIMLIIYPFLPSLIDQHTYFFFEIFGSYGPLIGSLFFSTMVIFVLFLAIKSTNFKLSKLGFDFSHIRGDILFAILFVIIAFTISTFYTSYIDPKIPENIRNFNINPYSNFTRPQNSTVGLPGGLVEVENPFFPHKITQLFLMFVLFFLFVGVGEEAGRLFVFSKIESSWGTWAGVLISALFFGFWHLGISFSQFIDTFIAGLLFNSFWLIRGRRIVAPIILHGLINFLPNLLFAF